MIAYPKSPRIETPSLRELARGMPCMMQTGECSHDPATTVWVHEDSSTGGKGLGMKSHDHNGAFGCGACHDWYGLSTAPRGEKVLVMEHAMRRTRDFAYLHKLFTIDKTAAKRVRHYE